MTRALATIIGAVVLILTVLPADAGNARARPKRTGQTLCWDGLGNTTACAGTGQDGEERRGIPHGFVDNGDGTITDRKTALTWEKLSDDGTIHDKDDTYAFITSGTAQGGSVKIAALNTPPCFAGQCDWRIPHRFELESILHLGGASPAVPTFFDSGCAPGCSVLACSCTPAARHWSSTSVDGPFGWYVDFFEGEVGSAFKLNQNSVRAVRGGS